MLCPTCHLPRTKEFSFEALIRLSDKENLSREGVWVFTPVVVWIVEQDISL